MNVSKIIFKNRAGHHLEAILEQPFQQQPKAYALFVHCFSCGKNLPAAVRISHALTLAGIAVFRFDFTGLGESEGDFSTTNFDTNLTDIADAVHYLTETYEAPSLLIGHSLGGTAVLHSAPSLPSIKAVVTIAAPATAAHVLGLFGGTTSSILKESKATFVLAGKEVEINRQFIESVENQDISILISALRVPLLILHAPGDNVVSIDDAAKIYEQAHHPKSFLSLDGADHLLKREKDATYAANMIAAWVMKYLDEQPSRLAEGQVDAWMSDSGFTIELVARGHTWLADEPKKDGGNDLGPTPYELLSGALATCTAMTMKMYAQLKKWDIGEVKVRVTHGRDYAKDCETCAEEDSNVEGFERVIIFASALSAEQKKRLLHIADRCPVHRTLSKASVIVTTSESL